MSTILKSAAALALVLPLTGCFVFIPGAVVGKISDGITGSSGEHCVTRAAAPGSLIRLPDGRVYSVASVSGTSMRCTSPDFPIRAELVPQVDRQAIISDASKPLPAAPQATQGTEAERAAACQAMTSVKPGAPQAEFQAAWQKLRDLGMSHRDCK